MRYQRGTSRHQQSFLSLDDQISKKHVIRIINEICEEYVNQVVIRGDFEKGHRDTGRKAYHPSDLLKILVYGYFNGISSSRKLERESGRNIEIKWLTSVLVPDHKTISDFRKDNPSMISGLFDYLINIFKAQGLVTGKSIAVDGSKIKAYANAEINITTIAHKLENIEGQVEKYLKEMDEIDSGEDEIETLSKRKAELEKELASLAEQKEAYENSKKHLEDLGEKRMSTTDSDAKVMRGRYGKYWGYNLQSAVDTEHHLITNLQVTDNQNDKGLLEPIAQASQEVTGQKPEEVLADAGYYKVKQLESMEIEGITSYVAINWTPSQTKDVKNGITFTYDKQKDLYSCGEGKKLHYFRKKTIEGREAKIYKGKECLACPKRSLCTKAQQRIIQRNENQEWLDTYYLKMASEEGRDKLICRKSVVEHPFGTMKYYMGQIPILLRGKGKVQTEMNLYAIGYNLKRYFNIRNERNDGQLTNNKIRQAA